MSQRKISILVYWNVIYTKYIRRLYIHIHHYYDLGEQGRLKGYELEDDEEQEEETVKIEVKN